MNNQDFQHKIGDKVLITISGIKSYGAFCDIQDGGSGLIHISEIDNRYIADIQKALPLGSAHEALIIAYGDKPNNYFLSIRKLIRRPRQTQVNTIKPLGRRDYNKKMLGKISFEKMSVCIDKMVESEYQRLKGGN